MKRIDLNSDMGELSEAIHDGTQEALMPHLTSVNIACGGHAGDPQMMQTTIRQALRWNVAIGAHPGYPDRENFGRINMDIPPQAIADSVFDQVTALGSIALACGAAIAHVKPHGALYNQAARNRTIARAVADGIARWRKDVVLVGLAGSLMIDVFRDAGFHVIAEAFADRRYEAEGTLRSRQFDDALIADPEEAARQALRIVKEGTVFAANGTKIAIDAQTICIHSDTPHAPQIAATVARTLRRAGVDLKALS